MCMVRRATRVQLARSQGARKFLYRRSIPVGPVGTLHSLYFFQAVAVESRRHARPYIEWLRAIDEDEGDETTSADGGGGDKDRPRA